MKERISLFKERFPLLKVKCLMLSAGAFLVALAAVMTWTAISAIPNGAVVVINSYGTWEAVLDFVALGLCILLGSTLFVVAFKELYKMDNKITHLPKGEGK